MRGRSEKPYVERGYSVFGVLDESETTFNRREEEEMEHGSDQGRFEKLPFMVGQYRR